jgi:hypothetical protein
MIFVLATIADAQYPYRNIRDIQYRPNDSLLVADQLQNVGTRWTLQGANYFGDTVRIVGVCVIPAKVFTYTSIGYNLVLADTGYNGAFSHIFVRPNLSSTTNPSDSVYYASMLGVQPGDIVEITGPITEFPSSSMNSMSQIVPNRSLTYDIIGQQELPPITNSAVGDFYRGLYQSSYPNGVKYTTGEPLEAKYVELTNLTVVSRLSTGYGVLIVDAEGNNIATYDASKWFTTRVHKDPTSTYAHPADFSQIDTLRGWITPVSGQQNNYGYNIAPVYPGDMVLGVSRPAISRVYRYPVIVTPDSTPRIEAVIKQLPLGSTIASRLIYYSVNDGPYNIDTMLAISSDTLYSVNIPAQSIGTDVKYFIKVTDINGYYSISANGAGGAIGTDTSKGLYFYKVTDGVLTIHDVQYTTFTNGRSPYVGAVTTIRGIVTSDTSDYGLAPINNRGVSVWHMQSGNGPFSGLWFNGIMDTLSSLQKGDSVAITGTITEYHNYTSDVTCLDNISAVEILSVGNPIPDPVKFTTGTFGSLVSNGDFNAEPWEGMLVEFDTVEVTNLNPTYQVFTEYNVDDKTGEITVLRDGKNTYSTVEGDTIYPGTTILKTGDKFAGLRGILHYSYNRYKVAPRTNADYGTYLPLSVGEETFKPLPAVYELSNNYPNPFNPKTVIEYGLPRADFVTLKVYNILGQEVATLKNEIQKAGRYHVTFDGSKLSSGIYFYRLQTSNFNQVKKMMLVK